MASNSEQHCIVWDDFFTSRCAGHDCRKRTTLKITAINAPATASDNEQVERFYERLEGIVQRKSTFVLILGDFNAKLVTRMKSEQYIGNCGIGKRNERGRRLADIVEAGKLYATNSFSIKRRRKCWIWRWIDYVLVEKRRLVTDIAVIQESAVSVHSDHRLLRAKFILGFQGKIFRRKALRRERIKQFDSTFLGAVKTEEHWDISDSAIYKDYVNFLKRFANLLLSWTS